MTASPVLPAGDAAEALFRESPLLALNVRARYRDELTCVRTQTRAALDAANIDTCGRALARFVADYRARHGHGPVWAHVAAPSGLDDLLELPIAPPELPSAAQALWRQTAVSEVLLTVRAAGWLRWSRQPRSMAAGPRHRSPTRV